MSNPQQQLPRPGLEEDVLNLYVRQAMSIKRVSTILGVSYQYIRQTLKKHNVLIRGCDYSRDSNPPPSTKIPGDRYQLLVQELKEGKRHSPLARKYGVSRERIRQIAQTLGTPTGRDLQKQDTKHRHSLQKQQQQLGFQVRRQQRLEYLKELSRKWKSKVDLDVLAAEYGMKRASLLVRVCNLRRHYPTMFPPRRGTGAQDLGQDLKTAIRLEDSSSKA